MSYMADSDASTTPFDFNSIPKVSREQSLENSLRMSSLPLPSAPHSRMPRSGARSEAVTAVTQVTDSGKTSNEASGSRSVPSAADSQSAYASQLAEVPELASYGPVLKSSSKPVDLTESETEYVVACVKHIFKEHVVFQVRRLLPVSPIPRTDVCAQFNVRNTVDGVHLEQVSVLMTPSSDCTLIEDFIIPIPSLPSNTTSVIYVSFTSPTPFALGTFTNSLKFISKEVDPESGEPEEEGYDDEYQVEELELGVGDYMEGSYAAFGSEWDRLRSGPGGTETFALTALESLKGASILSLPHSTPRGPVGHCTDDVELNSCLRLDYRTPQHVASRRHRPPHLDLRAHPQPVWSPLRWRRQGPRQVQDDLRER